MKPREIHCRECGLEIGRLVHERGILWRIEKGEGFGGWSRNVYFCAEHLPPEPVTSYWR